MNLTPSQREAIERRGGNLLVAASAGSGKTEVLARRCAALIGDVDAPCPIDRLLVVTFTRAAAAELRLRIAQMLAINAASARSADMRIHLRRQRALIDTADIGTIDAWAARLLREHFAEAGIDAAFSVLGEQEAHLLRGEVLADVFDWLYTSDAAPARNARGWLRRNVRPGDGFLRRMVLTLSRYREQLTDPDAWFARQAERHALSAAEQRTDAARLLARALADECAAQADQLKTLVASQSGEEAAAALEEYRDRLMEWQKLLRPGSSAALFSVAEAIGSCKFGAKRRGRRVSEVVEEVRKRWFDLRLKKPWSRARLAQIVECAPQAAELVALLLQIEAGFQQRLETEKASRGVLEFGDVLRRTLDLLGASSADGVRTPTEVARKLQERYRYVLVDEYQDTSPVQVELVRLASRGAGTAGNRFLVGDVKQSIYGFRRAEPRLFAALLQEYERDPQAGRVVFLSDNFRSHAGIVEGLNRIFGNLFDLRLGGSRFGPRESLSARRDDVDNPDFAGTSRVEMHAIESPTEGPGRRDEPAAGEEDGEEDLERVEYEALLAAQLVKGWLAEGLRIPARDPAGRLSLRPMDLGDVVVLLRSARQHAPRVAAALRRTGVPAIAAGRDSIFDSIEVRDARNVLRLLANRRQDLALAAYLRSPLAGLSAADLLRIRAASPGAEFAEAVERFTACGECQLTRRRLAEAISQLDRWRTASHELEPPALLSLILDDTALPLFARGRPGGAHRAAVLHALQELAGDFARTGRAGAAEFVAYLDGLEAADLDPGVPVAAGENVVRVMTIHAAKGLEFPVVFLLNAGARFNDQSAREALLCDEDVGLGLRFQDRPSRGQVVSAAHHVGRRAVHERLIAEELRLLYVAATRCQERLVVIGHAAEGAWETARLRFGEGRRPPPLISRMNADTHLEWLLMATAAGGAHVPAGNTPPLIAVRTHRIETLKPAGDAGWRPDTPDTFQTGSFSEAWFDRASLLLRARPDLRLALAPAVLSVSAAKRMMTGGDAGEAHALRSVVPALGAPDFVEAEPGGADRRAGGTALHRFMQHADLSGLADARDIALQLSDLVARGAMAAADAELVAVDDVVWLARSPEFRALLAGSVCVRREVPFVFALPPLVSPERAKGAAAVDETSDATLIRGVIDVMFERPEGLALLDYKTDMPIRAADWEQRIRGYSLQLRLYAHAAGAIFGRPVCRAVLGFVSARRFVDVDLADDVVDELRRTFLP